MASKNARSKSPASTPSISASGAREKTDANAVKSTVASAPAATAVKAPVAAPVAGVVAAPVAVVAPAAPAAPVAVKAAPVVAAPAPAAETRDRSAIVALIARLRDQDAEVARDAAATLGGLPVDAHAVAALAAVLFNTDGYFHSVVRAAAASALGQLRDRSAVDALIHASNDSMAEASEEAIKALASIGDARALPALEKIVRNHDGFFLENVIRAAQESQRKLRGPSAKA